MGNYATLAYSGHLLPQWPPLHEIAMCEGPCEPRIKADCSECGRVWQWCTASAFTVRKIIARTWRCSGCADAS